jgi:hypothetical protein
MVNRLAPVAANFEDFTSALDEYRFDDAERMLGEASDTERTGWELLLETRSSRGLAMAHALGERLFGLSSAADYPTLLEIAEDPVTNRLLPLLSEAARNRAELYLRQASNWAESQARLQEGRLDQAQKALDALDLPLARGLLIKIDSRFLDTAHTERRDALFISLESRTMELEDLTRTAELTIGEVRPKKPRRWWQRRG